MKITLPERGRARIEMLPLIDIVFLLLVFFIYAMLSMAVHHGVPVELPSSASAELERQSTLSVSIQKRSNGEGPSSIFVNQEKVELAEVNSFLREEAAKLRTKTDKEPDVLLFADRTIDYQELFQVLDQVNEAGLYRVSLQADVDREQ